MHIEDFAQVKGSPGTGEGKYRSTIQEVAGLAYRGWDHEALQEWVRRCVFNLLVGNGDAHLKNWSLIYPDRRIARLSPAYDLVCTAAYPNHAELGLPFFGDDRLDNIGRDHFLRLQKHLRVSREDVLDVVDETLERFHQAWAGAVPEQMPGSVLTWIDDHADATAARLASGG